jgi:uncharacterized protein
MIDSGYVLAGALTGFLVGMTGVGGGALMTPILLIIFGVSPSTAIATDLWFAAITKAFGARIHCTHGNVDWQVAKRLWLGSLPTSLLIVIIVSSGVQVTKVGWLTNVIGVVVLITAIGLLVAPKILTYSLIRRKTEPEYFKASQPALTVVSGVILGLCVALTSVGAGALGSVFLLYLYPFRMTPHHLVATDIVHAIPLAVVAGLGYLIADMVNGWILANLLVGSIPAVVIGSMVARRVNGRWIQIALAIVLIAASVKLMR